MVAAAPAVLWYRRDLRVHDLPALDAALARGPVAPLFVLDPKLIAGRWPSPNRAAFLLGSLIALDRELLGRGTRLHIRFGDPVEAVPAFARACGASAVVVSRDYAPYGRRRDARVEAALRPDEVSFEALPGQLIAEPEQVRTQAGGSYTVFSPFHRRWLAVPRRALVPVPDAIAGVQGLDPGRFPSPAEIGAAGAIADLVTAGEPAARARLAAWAQQGVADYTGARDLVGIEGTSRLSQDLRWGLLSPLEVMETIARMDSAAGSATQANDIGAAKFIAELCWREFYASVLFAEPRVARAAWRPEYDSIEWRHDPAGLAAWKEGRTGYPVVDAGMRQLVATGWMHNRARMVAASFLVKHLLIDWRAGEAHFMRHLVDGDPASNNGGWQWAASTGADAQPYFRIFNPITQGERYDPDGQYIRRWVPELAAVPVKYLHAPWTMPPAAQEIAGCRIGRDYPEPIVEQAFARQRALAAFAAVRGR